MIGWMLTGAGIALVFFLIGYVVGLLMMKEDKPEGEQIEKADKYDKYRNKDGLLSARTIKKKDGK